MEIATAHGSFWKGGTFFYEGGTSGKKEHFFMRLAMTSSNGDCHGAWEFLVRMNIFLWGSFW
jgi:hypothetical protein